MDNGWKSKKDKNGNVTHYKTNNAKKPFGVSRELAAEEVQAMRKNGYKARLIKTNRKKELYAPYKGVLPIDQEDKPVVEKEKPGMKQLSSTQLNEMDDYAETIRSKNDIGGGVFSNAQVMFVAKTPEQEEMVQNIIDEINKKYGVNYSFVRTRPGGYIWYNRLPESDNDKTVRLATKNSGSSKTQVSADKVRVKFDMEGDRKRGGVYAAVITGTDPRYGLKREFLNGDKTTVNNHYVNKHFNTELPKGTIVELSNEQNAGFYIVDPKEPHGLRDLHLTNKGQDLLKMKQHFRKKEEQ